MSFNTILKERAPKQKPKKKQPVLVVKTLDQYPKKEIDWIIKGWFAAGILHLLAGPSGVGKSFVSNWIASRLSRGLPMHDGRLTTTAETLFYNAEELVSEMMRPRFEAFNADMSKIHIIDSVKDCESKHFSLSDHINLIDGYLLANRNIKLIVIDPIINLARNSKELYNAAHIRESITPLQKIIEKHKVACIGILHFRKDASGGVSDRIAGSSAWTQVSRATYLCDNMDDDVKVLTAAQETRNLPLIPNSYQYKIISEELDTGQIRVDLEWLDMLDGEYADTLIQEQPASESKANKAYEYLFNLVKDSEGISWSEMVEKSEMLGASEETLRRQRIKLAKERKIAYDDKNHTWYESV